jgi:hypothetical protein
MNEGLITIMSNDMKIVRTREVEIEFLQWMHPTFGIVPVDPKTPLILKAQIREEV